MTIQNPSTGPIQPNSARNDEANEAQEAAQSDGAESNETRSAEETSSGDRVEISEAARSYQSEVGSDAALIELGRSALESSSLSAERVSELQERVENGHYTEPEVAEQVAEGLAEDFGGVSSESAQERGLG